jgi:hypothetical protein
MWGVLIKMEGREGVKMERGDSWPEGRVWRTKNKRDGDCMLKCTRHENQGFWTSGRL